MSNQLYVKLNNGVEMPMAGIGTFLLSPQEAEASCISALQDGYRLIDTANAYVNEKAVGPLFRRCNLLYRVEVGSCRSVPDTPGIRLSDGRVTEKTRSPDPASGYCFGKPFLIDRLAEVRHEPIPLHTASAPKLVKRPPGGGVCCRKLL